MKKIQVEVSYLLSSRRSSIKSALFLAIFPDGGKSLNDVLFKYSTE